MKINALHINHFRGFKQLKLDFSKRTTVFVGINGVGKTALLDCLAILLSHPLNKIRSATGKGRTFIEWDINNDSNETWNSLIVSFAGKQVTWHLTKTRSGKKATKKTDLKEIELIVEQVQSTLENTSNASIPLTVYYPVNRAVLDIPLRVRGKQEFKQLTAYDQALVGKAREFRVFFEWFRKREDIENEYIRQEAGYRDKQLEWVRKAVQLLMPGYSDLRVRRSPLRMSLMKQKQELIINQLSDGEKCLLALTGDLARRLAIAHPALPNPLEGQAIVLIDEIELHLHPQWQRRVIPTLESTFPNCQFVVSTHSPQVISEVQRQERQVYFLRTTEEEIVAEPVEAYGKDTNFILEIFMETEERPAEVKQEILALFRLIDEGKLEEARNAMQQLSSKIGNDEPELVRAEVLIHRKEVLGR